MESSIAQFSASGPTLQVSNTNILALDERSINQSESNQNQETFESNDVIFINLPKTNKYSDYFNRFQEAALQEGWDGMFWLFLQDKIQSPTS